MAKEVIQLNTTKIHYLFHSGFALEVGEYFLVFDYFLDSTDGMENNLVNGVITEEIIKEKENIFVFSSHGHNDHFNPIIFSWEKANPNIKYILSKDINLSVHKANYFLLGEKEKLQLGDLQIQAFGSTDIGVSFLVKLPELVVFHAGDLNWWHWKEDSPKNLELAENEYKAIINQLLAEKIDIAFFPVDSRLEEFYYLGGEYFIEKIKPKLFVPMHFGNDFNVTEIFSQRINNPHIKTAIITQRGQVIQYSAN